jgi:ABC-type nitrate/sulfonate/bicarbonate transport system permease component
MLRHVVGRFNLQNWVWAVGGISLFLGLWAAASLKIDNAVLLPDPISVVQGFVSLVHDGTLESDVAASMRRVLGGFALASFAAVPLALLMAFSRRVGLLLSPIITFLRPIPPIAWIPIAILWFGIGDPPSYFSPRSRHSFQSSSTPTLAVSPCAQSMCMPPGRSEPGRKRYSPEFTCLLPCP